MSPMQVAGIGKERPMRLIWGGFPRPVVFPHEGIAKPSVRAQILAKALGVVLEFRAARLGCFTQGECR
jgi:hypothetical protein